MDDKYAKFKYGLRDTDNRFSFWWGKTKDCGIPVPKTMVFSVPAEVIRAAWDHGQAGYESWFYRDVAPVLRKEGLDGAVFIKNGVFSNKFDARYCFCNAWEIPHSLMAINGAAAEMIMGYDGEDELVVRERIPYDCRVSPCIYDGLPLRPEFRVFYDFDERKVLYVCNYWEYDYVRPHLFTATDSIIFDHEAEHIRQVFKEKKDQVAEMVAAAMQNVQNISGPWSIDILYTERNSDLLRYAGSEKLNEFWMIDMAVAEQSAFWELRERQV